MVRPDYLHNLAAAAATAMPTVASSHGGSSANGYRPPKNMDDSYFHFKICEPRISEGFDYRDEVRYHLSRISSLVCVECCVLERERPRSDFDSGSSSGNGSGNGVCMAKVRLCLSPEAARHGVTLDAAVKHLCRAMMTQGRDGKRSYVKCLTERSIWGIIPVSPVFKAYWTASFFHRVLTLGHDELNTVVEDWMRESRPYALPTFMVFGFAVIAGLHDSFHFMNSLLGVRMDENFDLNGFLATALPTVAIVFNWLGHKASSGKLLGEMEADFDHSLDRFKWKYDEALRCFEDMKFGTSQASTNWTKARGAPLFGPSSSIYRVCEVLCDMSVAASRVLVHRRDLLDKVMDESNRAAETATISGFATVGSACFLVDAVGAAAAAAASSAGVGVGAAGLGTAAMEAGALVGGVSGTAAAAGGVMMLPIVAGGIAVICAWSTWESYCQSTELKERYASYKKTFAVSHSAWATAFNMLLTIEWFRLKDGGDPSQFNFSDGQFQRRWEGFVRMYRDKIGPMQTAAAATVGGGATSQAQGGGGGGVSASEEELISIWLDVQVRSLRKMRTEVRQ